MPLTQWRFVRQTLIGMRIIRNSLPILLLAIIFSSSMRQKAEREKMVGIDAGALPETKAVFRNIRFKMQRKAEARRNAQARFTPTAMPYKFSYSAQQNLQNDL